MSNGTKSAAKQQLLLKKYCKAAGSPINTNKMKVMVFQQTENIHRDHLQRRTRTLSVGTPITEECHHIFLAIFMLELPNPSLTLMTLKQNKFLSMHKLQGNSLAIEIGRHSKNTATQRPEYANIVN